MSTERINKFQPDRTLYLRGFTGFGAAASLCEATPSSFKVYGVFRDQADFCVLVIYDADNLFEHYSLKYLPDFNLSGMVLSFDLSYQGLQPVDSAKYSWIDWSQLDVVKTSGEPVKVRLWDYATLAGGEYSVAQGTYTIAASGGSTIYDRLTLFVNNASFDFVAAGGESAAYVAQTLANSINTYDWSTFRDSSVSVIAAADGTGQLTLKNARTGHLNVAGTAVSWLDGAKFPGIASGSTIYLGGSAFTVASVLSPTSLVLTTAAPSANGVVYLAEYGGVDGNAVQVYMVVRPGNQTLSVNSPVLQLSGGNADNVTWSISLDLTALGIDQIRQAWLTFAPQLASSAGYSATEWTATFTNWSVTDPSNVQALQCAGPGSVRVGNSDPGCAYTGSGWQTISANNYWRGFARQTENPGDSVSISYSCASVHDLYLGTSLYKSRGVVAVALDGQPTLSLDCFLNASSEVVTRRVLARQVVAGNHTLTIKLLATNHVCVDPEWDINSLGYQFLFDYIEAAIPADLPDALVAYPNVSPALDFDTDATYKVSPERLLWHLTKLGFAGQINEYIGVYWWNQRARVNGVWNSATVAFGGTWALGDTALLTLGDPAGQSSVTLKKTVSQWDTLDTIAAHFVYYINAGSVSMWAEKSGPGQLTVHTRTPNWGDPLSVNATSANGTIGVSGNLNVGSDGLWQIDASAESPINFPVRQWHADLFQAVESAALTITTSFSMELVNPPDDGTQENAWIARFADGSPANTATDFMGVYSSQCAPVTNLTNYQEAAYAQMAQLQSAANLIPWLQFGEFLWWYFSSKQNVPLGYVAETSPISIGLATPHNFSSGDRVVVSGVGGTTSANGTWTVTVTDDTHFSLDGSSANGNWVVGTGTVCGGSMAYYDSVTTAAASSALGRSLHKFTCQDDDPAVNSGADASFLATRLQQHVDAIREAVLAVAPAAQFEVLFPNDVNNAVCYMGEHIPYPQGGRLNAAVNLPVSWRSKITSGLDRFKVEALSWSATYLNLDLVIEAVSFAVSDPMQWSAADVAYLVPWFNGTCPWPLEFQLAFSAGLGLINLWAYDHLALMSWPLPLPSPTRRSFFVG